MNEDGDSLSDEVQMTHSEVRLHLGEAWMHCNQCGGKLWSFDGKQDADRGCPYQKAGRCEPPQSR